MTLDSRQERMQTLALLELLGLGHRDIEAGRTRSLREVVARLRAKNKTVR